MRALAFVGGHVFDGRLHRKHTAVGVRDGRIVEVGSDDDIRRALGSSSTEVVDLDGALLLPGFQDAHMHPLVGGLERLRCELTELDSVEDYLAAIRDHGGPPDPEGWVRGGGWSVPVFGGTGPTAELLDRVVPDRPAFIVSSDHHNAWVNSRALEVAGITASTPDPPDGWLERDRDGRPTGCLHEAAMALVQRHVVTHREEHAEALRDAQAYLHGWGITGWHDALIGGYAGLDDPTQAYLDLIEAGELTARVTASQWWDRDPDRDIDEQVEALAEQRDRLGDAGLDASSVKVMMDGITETFTASVADPYLGDTGCPCGDTGLPFLDPEQAARAVVALDAAGFQLHFHAIGDQAVRHALDAVEVARRANGMNDHRHQIAHLQLVHPHDRRRFRELGVTANVQGMWVTRGSAGVDTLLPHLDEERASWHFPFRDIAEHGADLAGGSDWPVNPPEPMTGVHGLVNRTTYSPDGSPPEPLVPEQAISLAEALCAYTEGSARVSHRRDVGSIQVGARADLVVLDRDPFLGPPEEIAAARVRATFVAGERVHG